MFEINFYLIITIINYKYDTHIHTHTHYNERNNQALFILYQSFYIYIFICYDNQKYISKILAYINIFTRLIA